MAVTNAHPYDLAPQPVLAVVEAWLARQPISASLTWCAFADPDGAVGLVPSGVDGETCWPLLLAEEADGFSMTVCDPDDPVELGVFPTIEDALRGLGCWMVPANASYAEAA